jgi:pre-mRNA-splicing factor 38A
MATHKADGTLLLDNRGYSGALIRGQNPALLFDKAIRDRVTESLYWKEQCFGLNAATLCDRASEITFLGGTINITEKPTPFLCLAFKLCQLVPKRQIILEYLNFTDRAESPGDSDEEDMMPAADGGGYFKYLRVLAAFYVRLAWSPVDIYKTLEPLLADRRKLRYRTKYGFRLTYIDEFVDDLLTKERICGVTLWKLPARMTLEDQDLLDPRVSPLEDELSDSSSGEG